MNTDELRVAAKKRLKAQHDFKQFLAVWGAVSVLLIVIWLLTGAWGYFWPIWPIFVMGIALVFVGLDAYGPSKHITEDAIDAEVARLVNQQQQRAAAREAASQPNPAQAPYAGQSGYEQHPYQAGQTGQAPVYDPAQYGQTAAYDTSQYAGGQTGGYGTQPTQGAQATQQYGAYQAPSAEAPASEAPAAEPTSDWVRAAEPTPTEQFAAVFSGTDRAPEAAAAPNTSAEPAESIVLESTSTGDAETVAAAAD
ncbi:2TM domain-containing protein, partial [Plantibacter sp. CFBP 13570]|uniref:2TM domain-containing protein n=1 Tax=Plantibacter sp. CFBP 13570 TaxID=2775272 RepID=UPI001930CD31